MEMNHQTHFLWLSGPHINSLGMQCMCNHHMALLGFDQDGASRQWYWSKAYDLVQADNWSALTHVASNILCYNMLCFKAVSTHLTVVLLLLPASISQSSLLLFP